MKRTNVVFGLMLVILTMAMMSGCGKYEDGPSFTLTSKTSRLEGDWKLFKYDGQEVSTPWNTTFGKNGSFKEVVVVLNVPVTYEGTWKFLDGKESILIDIQNYTKEIRIRRLTKDEFWYLSEDGKLWEMVRP